LRLPPRLAPTQAVVLLVRGEEGAGERAATLADELAAAGLRVELDDRLGTSFGRRAVDWELKGVPVRVEVGPRDLAAGVVTLVRRDTLAKEQVPLDGLVRRVTDALDAVQQNLHAQARERQEARTADADSIDDAIEAAQSGFGRVPWDLARDAETKLNEAGVSVRCLQRADGDLPGSSDEAGLIATVGKAY
jgi:prolyl-tRNA synthetase